jgi:guanine deaminase
MATENEIIYLRQAIELARIGIGKGMGGPFGCVIVKEGEVVGSGYNCVTSCNDPTAHAEVVAIRDACKRLGNYQLTDCDVYASCEPCPMCLGALYWARPRRVLYALTRQDAAEAGFDDDFIYREIQLAAMERKIPFIHRPLPDAEGLFALWRESDNKRLY